MRTKHVRKQIPLANRALFGFVGKVAGMKVPDVAYVMRHRPEIFGREFSHWLQGLLRGESTWTVCERELFASYSSALQECEF